MTSTYAPVIVTICGSTRFRTEIAEANRLLTLAGAVVLAPGVFAHAGDEITEAQKSRLDALHLEKIRLSQAVLVVNPRGYVGESTAREVMYARDLGRRVWFLNDLDHALSVITQLQFSISARTYGEVGR